jgi:transcriptional repressor NrdR
MDKLARLNEVAYVRFASVYRRFKDIASFERELSMVRQGKHLAEPEAVSSAKIKN